MRWAWFSEPEPEFVHLHRAGAAPPGLEELHRLEQEFCRFSRGQPGLLYASFLRGQVSYVFVDHYRTADLERAEWHLRDMIETARRGEHPPWWD